MKKAGWGWNEERTAWGSPAPYLKFRQGIVRQAPTPRRRMGRKGEKKWKYTLGRNNVEGLAQATEGDESKAMQVL